MTILRKPSRRWIAFAFAGVLGLTTMIACAFHGPAMRMVVSVAMTPFGDFEAHTPPPAPDYADDAFWAALPETADAADRSPAGLDLDRQGSAPADVFFVHPTTYLSRKGWNQPLDDASSNAEIEAWVLPAQAGAFNGCCRVYAPKYRQATIGAFFDDDGNGDKALNLAYDDIVRAFDDFLAHRSEGRPFILAGHSQGARHIHRLLREVVTPDLIADRLVAAYTIGQALTPLDTLPVCTSATQTGCQISWNSQTENALTAIGEPGGICVNPLTWTADDTHAPASANRGSVDFGVDAVVEMDVADARCSDGRLLLTGVNSDNFDRIPFGPGNYHRYEFSLYHMNIRENAESRVGAFLKR